MRSSGAKRFVVIALVLASGCARRTAEPVAVTPTADVLMVIAFPQWKRGAEPAGGQKVPPTEVVKIHLPEAPEWSPWLPTPGKELFPQAEPSTAVAIPIDVVRLDQSHAVLLAQSTLLKDGEVVCGPSCSSYTFIGAYFFTYGGAGWTLSKRVDAAAFTMYGPNDPRIEEWPGHGFVFSFLDGELHQGATAYSVVLIGLQPDRALPLLETSIEADDSGTPVSAGDDANEDDGSDIDCGTLMEVAYAPPKNAQFTGVDCQQAGGSWHFDGNLVHFKFSGTKRKDDGHGGLQPIEQWQSKATLQLQGDTLKLIEGTLPEFGF
jgi:hypothetical protein